MALVTMLVNASRPVPLPDIRAAMKEDYEGKSGEAAQRMFERDKALLEDLGIPIEWVPAEEDADPESGGYRIDKKRFFLSEVKLAPQEMAVVLLAGSPLLEQEGFPYRHELRLALNKLKLGAGDVLGATHVTVNVPVVHGGASVERALEVLAEALAKRKRVTFEYRDQAGSGSKREVDPYGIFCSGGGWYLVGLSHERGAPRQFAVHRMEKLAINPAKPRNADFEVPKSFDLDEHAHRPPWRWERHPPMRAVIDCAPEVAWLAERKLGVSAKPAGEWQRLTVDGVTNVDALADWALGFADRVRAVEPKELRDALRSRLERILARYEAPA